MEGIVEWWLLEQRIQQTSSAVEQAIEALAAKGIVEGFRATDGRVHYRLKAGRRSKRGLPPSL